MGEKEFGYIENSIRPIICMLCRNSVVITFRCYLHLNPVPKKNPTTLITKNATPIYKDKVSAWS